MYLQTQRTMNYIWCLHIFDRDTDQQMMITKYAILEYHLRCSSHFGSQENHIIEPIYVWYSIDALIFSFMGALRAGSSEKRHPWP